VPAQFHRLQTEHLRGGVKSRIRVAAKRVVSDGAPWIWNGAQDRWPGAVEVLDFYHASQPAWE
jgi:hypothetical protein